MSDAETLFERIIARKVPAEIVHENERVIAFRDIEPQARTHVLVVPKERYSHVAELAAGDPQLLADVITAGERVAQGDGVDNGYRIVFNTGSDAGQTVLHVHAHVLGGEQLGFFGRYMQ